MTVDHNIINNIQVYLRDMLAKHAKGQKYLEPSIF